MNARRLVIGTIVMVTVLATACFGDRVVGPDEPLLPAVLAVDRPTVQLFRYALGKLVEKDSVLIENNGDGPLGMVERIGGVDYLTPARTGWLSTELKEVGTEAGNERWYLILTPTYDDEEQPEADEAEVVLKAEGSPDFKRIRIITQTLPGASFEFSVNPIALNALFGSTPEAVTPQKLTVRNGGNGSLMILSPRTRYEEPGPDWLFLSRTPTSPDTMPEFEVRADPGSLGGGLHKAYLVFESPEDEETRAKPDSLEVLLEIGQPKLGVTTSTQEFSAVRGESDLLSQAILISNAGAGPIDALGTIRIGAVTFGPGADGWLETTLSGNEVGVRVRTDGLIAGDYSASFAIGSAYGGSRTIRVALTVEAPVFSPSTSTISFGLVDGDTTTPAPDTVGISNTGAGTFESLGQVTLGAFDPAAQWVTATLAEDELILTPTAAATALGAGTFTTALAVQTEFGGSEIITVTLAVSPGQDDALLSLSATSLEFTGVRGDPPPTPQEVLISNAGGGTLGALSLGPIAYPGQAGWLSTSLADSTLRLSVTTATLPGGTHLATVPVISASGGDATLEVRYNVGAPALTASSSTVSFRDSVGGPSPPPQTIALSNSGPGTFSSLGAISVGVATYSGAGGWLSTSYAGGTLTLTATTGALGAGTYGANVPVQSGQGGSASIEVSFTITRRTDAAVLVASPSLVSFVAIRGGSDPPAETVLLSNAGGGTLGTLGVSGITYGGGSSGWLVSTLVGTTLALDATTGSLAPGSHDATVGLTSTNGGSASVDVTFVVAAPILTLSAGSASFSGEEGGSASPASVSIDISNTGAGAFSDLGSISLGATVYGGTGGWLSANLGGGNSRVDLSAAVGALGAGTYTATVPVNSTTGGNEPIALVFTVAAKPTDPALVLSATSTAFHAQEGGGNPASQDVLISNAGGGGMAALGALSLGAISYGVGSGWLSASLAGAAVTLSATTGSLTAAGGPYTATVPVQSVVGGDQSISVTFHVSAAGDPADLEASPATIRMDATSGGSDPPEQDVLLYNGGGGPLGALSIVGITYGSGSGWLSASRSSSVVTLSADISGLAAGTYDATVEIESNNGGNETVDVTLEVSGPELTLSSTSASFSGEEGGSASPVSVSVDLSNTGAGEFSSLGAISLGATAYGGTGGWLTAALAGGDTRVDLSVTLGALSAGTYTATVPVNSASGGNGSIAVAFSVSRSFDSPTLAVSASSVGFTAVRGGSSPSSRTVGLSNSGGGTLADLGTLARGTITYTGPETGWLGTSDVTGSQLTLSPVTTNMPSGTHTGTVEVTSVEGGTRDVAVTVTILDPILTAETLGLSFTDTVGGTPLGQTVTLANTGSGTFANLGDIRVGALAYGPGASGWVSTPTGGTLVPGTDMGFSVKLSSLAPGQYAATVPISSDYGGSQSVSVTLSVVRPNDPPLLVLSPITQRFDALVGAGDPEPQSVLVSNGGGGDLGAIQVGPASYGPDATGWTAHSLAGSTITVQALAAGLAEGTYASLLPVTSSKGGAKSIDITLVVGSPRLTLTPRTVSLEDTLGGTGPEPAMVAMANTGGGTFSSLGSIGSGSISYGEGGAGWLDVGQTAPDSLEIRASTDGLPTRATPYEALVAVTSTFGGADTVRVAFTVAEGGSPPDLTLSVESMTFSGIWGGIDPSPQTVAGSNKGGGGSGALGALSLEETIYLDDSQDWVTTSVSESAITLQPTISKTTAGRHEALVVVRSENGGSDTLAVALDLEQPILHLSSRSVTFSENVGSSEVLTSQVFISNTGGGDRSSLGSVELGSILYSDGASGWLQTDPAPLSPVGSSGVTLMGTATGLSKGDWVARVPVVSQWGGTDTVVVTLAAREPDRSFEPPVIELVELDLASVTGNPIVIGPLAGNGVVVEIPEDSTHVESVGVRKEFETRLPLSGLRVGPAGSGSLPSWITGAFLDRTAATYSDPAILYVVVEPRTLTTGDYEALLEIRSEGLGEPFPRDTLRVVLRVR